MYLKRIVAHGFKSFADKINIELTEGISGIVGPNGSGKSNVVDAVRWVLGEQSVKSLRGEGGMVDVIFSGSHTRKAANMASITLVFDNTDHYLPVDFTEVSMKRQVYKDGTQEYYLNGERCRLKDITDLLLDTGVARESFNIISQGKVDEIILSKPVERRIIFEAAADVLKYKKRKEDALRKLARTHENMDRVNDIIHELKGQVEPLEKQKKEAEIYQEKTKQLHDIEIALITHDITEMNQEYKLEKAKIEVLNTEILNLTAQNQSGEAGISKFKLDLSKRQEELNHLSKQLLLKTQEVEKVNSQKQILLERKKYEVDDTKLHQNLIAMHEEQLRYQNDLEARVRKTNIMTKEIEELKVESTRLQNELEGYKEKRNAVERELNDVLKEKLTLLHKRDTLRNAIDNDSVLPFAVKQVLHHPKLEGIYDVIGNVVEVEETYSKAISIALGAANSYVITDTKHHAREAIRYLKEQNIGRATFYPMDTIKGRYLDEKTYESLKEIDGFIDVASLLVKVEPKYQNIIDYHLGNVLVCNNLEVATKIGQMLNHTKRIVTLDGSIVNIGGSLTGGSTKNMHHIIEDKYELEHTVEKIEENALSQSHIENKLNEVDDKIKEMEDKHYLKEKNIQLKEEALKNHLSQITLIKNKLEELELEIAGTNDVLSDSLTTEEDAILKQYYQVLDEKQELEERQEYLENQKRDLEESLSEYEFRLRRENSLVHSKNKELQSLEISVNRKDVKLDYFLNTLSDTYNITYERAREEYPLDMDVEVARGKATSLKKAISKLGPVNVGAIEEYKRVNERYQFLQKQCEDLKQAEDTLLEIIEEMDDVMKEEFKKTFDTINENFQITFRELFHGGKGFLRLTDPNHLLETGVEIIASPPGKKLTSISLLSGGEKTFTAISLLFAILKSRPVPFCILDEVEAALDEANVASFGEYITKMKKKTQFILITHKKKTMEYADVLYGITMQESGVSKLVSVKLEDIEE